jgi:hypothetical protein
MGRKEGIRVALAGIVILIVAAVLRLVTKVHSHGFTVHKVFDVIAVIGLLIAVSGFFFMARSPRGNPGG